MRGKIRANVLQIKFFNVQIVNVTRFKTRRLLPPPLGPRYAPSAKKNKSVPTVSCWLKRMQTCHHRKRAAAVPSYQLALWSCYYPCWRRFGSSACRLERSNPCVCVCVWRGKRGVAGVADTVRKQQSTITEGVKTTSNNKLRRCKNNKQQQA